MKLRSLIRKSWTRLLLLAVAVMLIMAATHVPSGEGFADDAAVWFTKPYELPRDVFDLPAFDRFRHNGKLDLTDGRTNLEALSDANLPAAQRLFDITAWKAFIALNWAAKPDGEADPSEGFDDVASPRVWEYWKPTVEVFLPDGSKPRPWGGLSTLAADHFKAGWRQSTTVDQGKQAFSGPLIDQNGRWVHYVSLMNRREFDYLVAEDHELYNLEGQEKFVRDRKIDFPVDDDTLHGAIEIKLAWKFLTDAEIKSNRFLMRKLPVVQYRPADAAATVAPAHRSGRTVDNYTVSPPLSQVQTLGLIGMHIAMRTRSSPQWIWATFEQIDNTRLDPASTDAVHPLPPKPSLSNPDDPEALVSANVLPAYNAVGADGKAIEDWDESKTLPPVEVLRLVPPPQGTARINSLVQAFLGVKGSVLRYYELDGTQWPRHPNTPAVPGGQPYPDKEPGGPGSAPESIIYKTPGQVVPVYLTNSTMETYFQKGYQSAGPLEQDDRIPTSIDPTMVFGTESCAGCHYSAGACIGFRKDFSGNLLRDANGKKIPIFGENGNSGLTANGNFSWLLQLEAKSREPAKTIH